MCIRDRPSINITKSATVSDVNGNGINDTNDIIVYSIVINNNGNLTLSNLSLTDSITTGNNTNLTLDSPPTFVSASTGSSSNTLLVGGTASFTASYTISQIAMDSGSIVNKAIIVASTPGQSSNISDTSDDPNTSTPDDPTIVTTTSSPSIKVLKSVTISDNGDGVNGKGDLLQYNISIQNTGNVTLSGLTVSDTITDGNSTTLNLTSGPFFSGSSQGSAEGSLQVSETANYIAFYLIDQQAVDSGSIVNCATAIASSPGQSSNVSDTSDDPNTAQLNDPTIVLITASPSIELTKTSSVTDSNGNNLVDTGDVIYYTLTIINKGQLTLSGLTISDTLTDGDGNALSLIHISEPTRPY